MDRIVCFNCQQLGHIARNCPHRHGTMGMQHSRRRGQNWPNNNLSCSFCGGQGHLSRECAYNRTPNIFHSVNNVVPQQQSFLRCDRPNARNTGKVKLADYSKVLTMLQGNDFVKYVSFGARNDNEETRVWLRDHHPGIVTGLSVSVLKRKEDYLCLSQQLRTHGKLENLISGTDGEPAIERAFEKSFQLKNVLRAWARLASLRGLGSSIEPHWPHAKNENGGREIS
eukprot:gene3571-9595_t